MNIPALLLVVGSVVVLTAGAELLVRGAAALALRMGISALAVGITVVGFGTSTPELGASITASLAGNTDLSIGNVVGSNIFNIAVILGMTALARPIAMRIGLVGRDLIVVVLVAFIPWLALPLEGFIPRWLGALLVLALAGYLAMTVRRARRLSAIDAATAAAELDRTLARPGEDRLPGRPWFNIVLVIVGLALLVVGSHFFVNSATVLARSLGVSDLVIGLTIVAAGTSMPELVTSVVAAVRGSPDIAIGNVIGSNIFNALGILGVAAMIEPQAVSAQVLWLDAPVMLGASVILVPLLWTRGRLSRGEGLLLVGGYIAYVVVLLTLSPTWFEVPPTQ
ncbi:MAG: calcium/sodium antiporter [Phycisphaerales bacterium]|nr:calcium/sodium antiporter [Phycisphaerales bacterium]